MAAPTLTRLVQRWRQAGPASASDGELLESFLTRRDEPAFAELLRRHGPMVHGVCRRVLRHADEADDAFQATFLVLVRRADSIRPREHVGPWLHGVAFRTARKAKRTLDQRRTREAAMPIPSPATSDPDLGELLDRELARLPAKYRLPIVLCDLEGRTRREAAAHLGWPEGTVAGRLSRGRALLAKRLLRQGMAPTLTGAGALLAGEPASAAVGPALSAATQRACRLLAAGASLAECAPPGIASLAQAVSGSLPAVKWKAMVVALVFVTLSAGAGMGTYEAQACHPRRRAAPTVACAPSLPGVPSAEAPPVAVAEPPKKEEPPVVEAGLPDFDPESHVDGLLLGWEKRIRTLDSVLMQDLVRTDKSKDGTTKTWKGEFRFLKPNLAALRLVQMEDTKFYELFVLKDNHFYDCRPSFKKLVVNELSPSRTRNVLDEHYGVWVSDQWPKPFAWLFGRQTKMPRSFREGLVELKRHYDVTVAKDVGPDNPHYIYIDAVSRSPKEGTFRRAQFVLFAATMLPRRMWFEFRDGDEVTWDTPYFDTDVKLEPANFTPPPPPAGWVTEQVPLKPLLLEAKDRGPANVGGDRKK